MTRRKRLRFPVFFAVFVLAATIEPAVAQTQSFIANGGFEQPAAATSEQAAGWSAYEQGYTLDSAVHHAGSHSVRCTNIAATEKRGALFVATLEQKRPLPVQISGWSKAKGVSGTADSEYSLYVDVQFVDGSYQYGEIAPFAAGTHDWQRKQVTLLPSKPIKRLSIYALFRNHSGTVWFDDFSGVSQEHGFDGQALAPPVLAAGEEHGWFIRDVAKGSALSAFKMGKSAGTSDVGVDLVNIKSDAAAAVVHAELVNRTDRQRAVTLYYVERFHRAPREKTFWWNDIRDRQSTVGRSDWSNLTRVVGIGAVEAISLYPFGCVTTPAAGRAVGVPPDLGPRVARIGYEADTQLLYVAFDLSLPARADAATMAPVRVGIVRYDVDPEWGFRSAAAKFYKLFPETFTRRSKVDGIWMPFTNPSLVPKVADFGFAYHEGDNSVASDDRLGILSFRYTEPMTYWQPLAKSVPRTYAAAMAAIQRDAAGADGPGKRPAQAVLTSGTQDPSGAVNVEFQNTPWSDGAVWFLNPNPRLPHSKDEWTKAVVNFPDSEKARYGAAAAKDGHLDGEYLDSLESWADTLDFSPESQRHSTLPLTFTSDTQKPALPMWFSVYEYTEYLSHFLHDHGALLMANTALARFNVFAGLLDVMGIETNWSFGPGFTPDSDAVFNFRRTMSAHKPYLLLQNTDYDKFGSAEVEKYFQRCLFYGVFPSMFSANAADNAYWQTPRWYDRDRPLFLKYIPMIKSLSAAGWEPITYAKSSDPDVYVERYGTRYLTVLNATKTAKTVRITVDSRLSPDHATRTIPSFSLTLAPGEVSLVKIGGRTADPVR